jgi:hypothetical protein
MEVVKPPMVLLESSHDLEEIGPCTCDGGGVGHFLDGLMKHEYEVCFTKFQAADYGPVRSQDRYILLASRIGLPKLPRTHSTI